METQMGERRALAELETTADAGRSMRSYGPDWDAAIEYGIDVTLLKRNLQLTPTERLMQLDDMLATFAELRP